MDLCGVKSVGELERLIVEEVGVLVQAHVEAVCAEEDRVMREGMGEITASGVVEVSGVMSVTSSVKTHRLTPEQSGAAKLMAWGAMRRGKARADRRKVGLSGATSVTVASKK